MKNSIWVNGIKDILLIAIIVGSMSLYYRFSFTKSQYTDISKFLENAKIHTEYGNLDYSNLKREKLIFHTANRSMGVQCDVYIDSTTCIKRKISLPAKVKISYFNYKKYKILVSISDIKGNIIVNRSERSSQISHFSNAVKDRTPLKSALQGAFVGLVTSLTIVFFRRRARLNK